MKQKKIIIYGMIFLTSLFTGCQKDLLENPPVDNSLTELPVNGDKKMISIEQNGIGIVYCLLNEKGEPSTVFHEGENFWFYLAIKNNSSFKAVYMPLGLGYGYIPDAFYVMNSLGDTIGRPFYFKGADYKLEKCPIIEKGESFVLEVPWTESRNDWHICTIYAHGSKNKLLSKGIYYTKLVHKFCFRDQSLPFPENQEEIFCTDSLYLKINFEIK